MGDGLRHVSRSLILPLWCAMRDLNPLQAVLETAALPTSIWRRVSLYPDISIYCKESLVNRKSKAETASSQYYSPFVIIP